jgi:protein-tyrosine phosphatase
MKYTIIFLMLGGLASYLAVNLGSWYHLLYWFSFSCVVLSAGYAGLGSCVFGKRPDGRIPLWSKIIHFPYMVFSLCVGQLARLLSRENPTDMVSEELILGRRLCASELPPGLSNYVDLTAEFEDPAEIRKSMHYVTLPILDAGVPTSKALHSAIDQLKPGVTFVHCAQGHGRTGLFALALLFERHCIQSFDEGMVLIKSVRPGVGLNKTQEEFIRKYIAEKMQETL